jgi:ketosteroid isomerase-like protein
MNRTLLLVPLAAALLGGCAATTATRADTAALAGEVRGAETAFARAMADRNFELFASFIADDAVFINAGQPLRGKTAVLLHWQRFFDRAQAPFAWAPQIVEVAPSGGLAYSEGPVTLPDGRVPMRYASTWRLEPDGRWRVVFDNGHSNCECEKKP